MLILGIETTCDETAVAIVQNGKEILTNTIHSQVELHRKYGGVFPELASRSHIERLPSVMKMALQEAKISIAEIDLISVAKGPGLIGPLLIGMNYAKALSWGLEKPFIGINHVEAHLYAAMMGPSPALFPSLGLVLSGGHTFLVFMQEIGSYTIIGSTVDDAIGEAYDKVAKMLNLPYPGGPEIETLALQGDPRAFSFKPGQVKGKPLHFSFSGLKTNVFYTIYGQNSSSSNKDLICPLSLEEKSSIAASFQEAALQDVVTKTLLALEHYPCQAIYIGGGVSCNKRLRTLFSEKIPTTPLFFPPKGLSLDNAAMIAGLAFHKYQRQESADSLSLEPETRPLLL